MGLSGVFCDSLGNPYFYGRLLDFSFSMTNFVISSFFESVHFFVALVFQDLGHFLVVVLKILSVGGIFSVC